MNECTCPKKDGQRRKCSDGQVMIAGNCPEHRDPNPPKRMDICRRTQAADWMCLNTKRDHAAIDVLEGATWCTFCGGEILVGNGFGVTAVS